MDIFRPHSGGGRLGSGADSWCVFLDARRYFKQSEIVLYREAPEILAEQAELAKTQQSKITGAHQQPPLQAGKEVAVGAG